MLATPLSPIVLFVYRRPAHTRQVLDALLRNPEAASTELFIYSDGPRRAENAPAVQSVRALCRDLRGFANVTLVERQENWGLARSVLAGVSEICASHGRTIVLEDDLIVSPHFLEYLNSALKKYCDADKVMQISAHMFPVPWVSKFDAAFLPMTTSWGWATWQRVWSTFQPHVIGPSLVAGRGMRKAFDLDGSYPYFRMLLNQESGTVDSWAIKWWLHVFLQKGITLFPAHSLVQNIGFDNSGTHCGLGNPSDEELTDFQVAEFPNVEIDYSQFEKVKDHLSVRYPNRDLLDKLKGLFK